MLDNTVVRKYFQGISSHGSSPNGVSSNGYKLTKHNDIVSIYGKANNIIVFKNQYQKKYPDLVSLIIHTANKRASDGELHNRKLHIV